MNVRLYSNIDAPEVYYNMYNIGAHLIFDSLLKHIFSAKVRAKKRNNMVSYFLVIIIYFIRVWYTITLALIL